jgi:hypothetical protein
MEESLDQVSRGEVGKVEMLTEFYKVFHPYIENASVSRQKARESVGVGVMGKGDVIRKSELPLRCFEKQDANLIKTKYGPALFHKGTKTYYSLTSFLLWKNKSSDEFTEEDCDFLLRTPIATGIEGVSIEIGRYGLYIKHKNKNIRLPSEYWDRIYDGTWSKEEIQDCIHGNANANTCKPTRAKRMSKKKGTKIN